MPPEDQVKPLTPEDVANKRFTPVRLREGYDMGEVDQFLDQVEAELQRLIAESDDLRSKLAAAGGTVPPPAVTASPQPVTEPAPSDAAAEAPTDAAAQPDTVAATASAPSETIKVVTPAEASSAALRLLELATKNADEVVAEARQEAEQIVVTARAEADTLEQEARTRAQNLDAETETKRSELLGDMEQERVRLDGEVDNLRAFEREYRSRLKSYFTAQLEALDGEAGPVGDEAGQLPGAGEPTRLTSILGGSEAPDDGAPEDESPRA